MKVSEKLDLIDKIGRELQSRYTFIEIDNYLAEFQIKGLENFDINSKWAYVKSCLKGIDTTIILSIADDLEVTANNSPFSPPPKIWNDTNKLRVFISHISSDKDKALRLKDSFDENLVSAFVAHEDIEPSLEWQNEIERALKNMDAMITVHTKGFSESYWTQQEVGFALGRGTMIVSLRMGEDPVGFISKHQAVSRRNRKAEAVVEQILRMFENDPRTAQIIKELHSEDNPFDLPDEIPF